MDVSENASSKYNLKLKYGGYFRKVKNSCRKRYCFGYQKSVYIDTSTYMIEDLFEEAKKRYPSNRGLVLSMWFIDKSVLEHPFTQLVTMDDFKLMLTMYELEKDVTIYVTRVDDQIVVVDEVAHESVNEANEDEDSEYCLSVESYHSKLSTDDESESDENVEGETHSQSKKTPAMNKRSIFSNVVEFRRALNHYEIVKTFVGTHSCIRSNKGGNKLASQGWVASVVTDRLKSDGDVSVTVLQKWTMNTYNVDVPYLQVFRGKEQAYNEIYGKWEDSFLKMNDFKEELLNRNPGSVVDIDFEVKNNKKHFLRFFISLAACSRGFLNGCRPYIALDGCHLKGKFHGVLVAATAVDGNNSIFPVAYGVLESENKNSWSWFLELLKKAIGTPNGLVISSDMQKGLEVAISQVYPNVEHRECVRHLYSNFKKHFHGVFFRDNLWQAARAYRVVTYERSLDEIDNVREDALTYINENHTKIWSRSKFGTTSKCDYITNNISEALNSWIGELRYQPTLDLLDSIREKIMAQFDKKRTILKTWKSSIVPNAKGYLKKISKNLGEYEVSKSGENRVEVKYKGRRWEVLLDEQQCTCRVWQVKGLPCYHAAAFIALKKDNWDRYVDPYFTVEKYKSAYDSEIAPMPAKDEWVCVNMDEKIYPPSIKRPSGRPRKNRIKSHDESKKRHKCSRCGEYGHHGKTCKNSASQAPNDDQTSIVKKGRGKKTNGHED